MIRDLSKGAKSLDDFCNLFHGGTSGPPALKPYNFDDVVAALNTVQPFDWAGFLNQRIHSTEARAPLGGIERSGWKLTYNGVRSDFWKAREETRKIIDLTYSIGMLIASDDGTVADVRFGGPAQKAGIAPSVKLIAVNTRQYTPTVLREAIAKTITDAKPLELLVKNGEFYQTFHIDYHDGERYPHLTRDTATPDLMSTIIAPKVKK
jgi:predicted metalloprotease with PDZ domain